MASLEEKIHELPPDLRREVEDFVEFLNLRRSRAQRPNPGRSPSFSWAGALKDMRGQYTSVELQHQISKWRIGGA
ncbi:MAG: DUF2281 domain-containing protein [Candidatus Hydrogenedentes bacterium]|nr:DUF2281 domain-containing protein [Candidatus Hydrogenedentota bacterium]